MPGSGRQEGGRKSSQGGRGSAEKARPAAIENYLKELGYPASRQDLLDTARDSGAPDDVMNILEKFSDRMYNSPVDVSKEVGSTE